MFFPQNPWWNNQPNIPDGIKFLSERWWELLRDWRGITSFSPPSSSHLSLIEDASDILTDLVEGRLNSSHQVDAIREELEELLQRDQLIRDEFPSEVQSILQKWSDLYAGAPAAPKDRYSTIKSKSKESRRCAMACRRLYTRCLHRRRSEPEMMWLGIGGIIASELQKEVLSDAPNFSRLDRLTTQFLMDCLSRGYELNYLATFFDRYLIRPRELKENLLHLFRRIQSRQSHDYIVHFVIRGISSLKLPDPQLGLQKETRSEIDSIQAIDRDSRQEFLEQLRPEPATIVRLEWSNTPDAGAAAVAAQQRVQTFVDYLDFRNPEQNIQLGPLVLVEYGGSDGEQFARLHPESQDSRPNRGNFEPEIDLATLAQVKELSEALRWLAVCRREGTPEVSFLAAWFAFEFLAGDLDGNAIESIKEFFSKTLALGDLRRRLQYWWRCLSNSPKFASHPRKEALDERANPTNVQGILELLRETVENPQAENAKIIAEICQASVLLRERTLSEAKLFSNNQLIAQTLSREVHQLQWDFQRFYYIRNKLVHRARIDHPLLPVIANRAKNRLYDLLRDLSGQLQKSRLIPSVGDILSDFRDSFDELQADLGKSNTLPASFVDRIFLN